MVHVCLGKRSAKLPRNLDTFQVYIWIFRLDDFDVWNSDQNDEDQYSCEQKSEERLTYAFVLP